jgi:hypothetical protein
MNCDEFLDALASSDERRQTAARWHASSCPSCAALAEVDARLKKELGEPEPLPQKMRAVWAAAADEAPRPTPARRASEGRTSPRQLPMQLVSLAAALLLLIAVGFLISQRPSEVAKQPDLPTPPTVKTIDASAELDKLLAQVTALEVELNKTSKQADLVDVRREADLLLATYSHW